MKNHLGKKSGKDSARGKELLIMTKGTAVRHRAYKRRAPKRGERLVTLTKLSRGQWAQQVRSLLSLRVLSRKKIVAPATRHTSGKEMQINFGIEIMRIFRNWNGRSPLGGGFARRVCQIPIHFEI